MAEGCSLATADVGSSARGPDWVLLAAAWRKVADRAEFLAALASQGSRGVAPEYFQGAFIAELGQLSNLVDDTLTITWGSFEPSAQSDIAVGGAR